MQRIIVDCSDKLIMEIEKYLIKFSKIISEPVIFWRVEQI
jgi:hypothetical protein